MSGIGQYMTICTGQLVEFLGRELQSSGQCHIVLLIKIGPNNYLKVTNVDRNEPRGFYRSNQTVLKPTKNSPDQTVVSMT
jgi:hypothetical protein